MRQSESSRRPRSTLRPTVHSTSGRSLALLRNQLSNAIGRLGTLAQPVVDAREIELQTLLLALGDRVEIAHLLQCRTALTLAAVGHHDVIEGLFLRATAS